LERGSRRKSKKLEGKPLQKTNQWISVLSIDEKNESKNVNDARLLE